MSVSLHISFQALEHEQDSKLLLTQRKEPMLKPEVLVKNTKSHINHRVLDTLSKTTFNLKFHITRKMVWKGFTAVFSNF